ncbi:MAG: arylsulfatase [Burkholderiales bacterium]
MKCFARAALAAAALTIAFVPSLAPAAAPSTRPNIVYIVADDLGWKDVGFHGSDIKTPNIDELARTGARLEQFYAQPMCTPTRAALMTGRYPFRYGLQTLVILSSHKYGLALDEWLMPQALKEAGYETAIIGKWHLGHGDAKYWPRQRGFDSQYGPLIGELDYFTHKQHGVIDWYRDNKRVDEPGYTTTLFGNAAVKLIEKHDPRVPLYLYLAFNAPHTPYQAPQAYLDRYKHIEDPARRAYAASISAMDDEIGRVVRALDKRGMRDNSLIVFQSDNGGTRVVALANWPGHIKPGTVVDGMMHVVDMYPTIANLAGAPTARARPLDGLDMWGTISEGKPSPRTEIVYNIEPFRAGIRDGDWKLVWRTPLPEGVELYDIAKDPYEKSNVAAANPDKVRALQKRANELAATMVKPLTLQTEFNAMRERLHVPPALPGEEMMFNEE